MTSSTRPLSSLILLLCGLPSIAQAQDTLSGAERPLLPAWSTAGDDGAPALWSNPGNLALDPDPSWALFYRQDIESGSPSSFAAAGNTGPLGFGLAYTGGPATQSWWTLSSGFGLRLDRDLSLGMHLGWQLPEGVGGNFATWDLGVGWRPLTWLGFSGVFQNIGVSGRAGVRSRSGVGLALRPWGERAQLGLDAFGVGIDTNNPELQLQASLRLEPVKGLLLRFSGDQTGRIGAGAEIYFGKVGAGAHAIASLDGAAAPTTIGYARSTSPEKDLFGKGNTVPTFTLDKAFPYEPPPSLFGRVGGGSYADLLERLQMAVDDPAVTGIVMEVEALPFSLAQVEELRAVIADARAHGKPVVAYLKSASNGAYLFASSADRVYLHPAGEVDLVGLSAEVQFYRGVFDLIGIEPQFAKRAEYKSSPEAYTEYGSSPAAREQMDALLDDMHGRLVSRIAEDRGRSNDQVQSLVDGGPYSAKEAEEKGLIDGTCYPDELGQRLESLMPDGYKRTDDYAENLGVSGWRSPHELAVIYITGAIVSGPTSPPGLFGGAWTAGSDTIVAQLRRAALEDSVKAVVIRVDSPGGSAFASDEIWHAVELVKKRGKPVIVSMGGVAASGGYYVSAGADAIYAEPTTITGSIGVYSGKFSAGTLFEKLGINTEIYSRGRKAGMYATSRPMDEVEFAAMDRMVGQTYEQFKERVSEGRGLSMEEVEEVARGRVWSGTRAKEQGLVDELGGFQDAMKRALEEAGIPEAAKVGIVTYDYRVSPRGQVSRRSAMSLRTALKAPMPTLKLPDELAILEQWAALRDESVWAVMPYTIEIK